MNDEKFLRNCSCSGSSRFLILLTQNKLKNIIRQERSDQVKLHKVKRKTKQKKQLKKKKPKTTR